MADNERFDVDGLPGDLRLAAAVLLVLLVMASPRASKHVIDRVRPDPRGPFLLLVVSLFHAAHVRLASCHLATAVMSLGPLASIPGLKL